jgi:ribose transport system substrate-binding protein
VLNYDRQIRSTPFELTSVAGTVEIGQIAAGEAIRLLTERHGAPKGKVLQILGDPGDNYTLDIQKGFESAWPPRRRTWRSSPCGDAVRRRTPAAFRDQLLVNPDIDLIFAHAAHLTVPLVAILRGGGQEAGRDHDDGLGTARRSAWTTSRRLAAGRGRAAAVRPGLRSGHVHADDPRGQDAPAWHLRRGRAEVGADHRGLGPQPQDPGAAITPENVDDTRFWGT